jgi:catechol 2,3-dioxygenase-like lactoylglutathione lyase family enzyme
VSIRLDAAIPILRILDAATARAFYEGFLGMSWDWEHRLEPGLPAFAQVSRGASVLFLSEHPGDGTPGSKVILRLHGIAAFREELLARPGSAATPDIEERPWGWRDLEIADPFGNRLVFSERVDPEGS